MMDEDKKQFKLNFERRLLRFSVNIIKVCRNIKSDSTLWTVADQLTRSATSIGANVIEAKGASSNKDYTRFFEISLKSAYETRYWLMIVQEISPRHGVSLQLMDELDEITKIIKSSVLTMKGRR